MSSNGDPQKPEASPPTVDAGTVDASFDYAGLKDLHRSDDASDTEPTRETASMPPRDEPAPGAQGGGDEDSDDETVLIDGKAVRGGSQPAGDRPDGESEPSFGSEPSPAPSGSLRLGWGRRRAPAPTRHPPHTTHHGPHADVPAGTELPATGSDVDVVSAQPRGLRILAGALRGPRARATQLMIGLLCGLLGFFAVVQFRLQSGDGTLRNARQSDLIRILNDLNDRSDRFAGEIRDLENRRSQLASGTNSARVALSEATKRKSVLGILSGTVPAHGPGITLRITDPQKKVDAAMLLDALQELRDAGAEAVQISGVRVIASTSFLDAGPGQVRIDGHLVSAPYLFVVIGNPDTLDPALRIPGGVFAVLDERGATPTLQSAQDVSVDAVRPATQPQYARPTVPGS